jgi:hypothetical protein
MGGTCNNMQNMTNSYKILVGKTKRENHFKDLGVDGRILEWISGKLGGKL